ncbi:MAG: hypothetical protein GXO60_00350 [Epsilonproteobacteria bacterium]|nr:hypothetical protein [Campylobacterota bacterium]
MKILIALALIAILINGCGLRKVRGKHKGMKRAMSQSQSLQINSSREV